MTAPRVSVVMPVFDSGRYLPRALRSVAAQTYPAVELVLVDDGSTDPRTLALLEKAGRGPGVQLHRTPNRGPAAARNLGIESARGAYILPLDSDDWVAPAYLERTVPILETEPAVGIVFTWVRNVGGHRGIWQAEGPTLPDLLACNTVPPASLYRREVWVDVGGYDPDFAQGAEDWDFWIGAATRGWAARCVPEALFFYRRRRGSREVLARAPGVSAALMRKIVAKHRAHYEANLDAIMAALYERAATSGLVLERIFQYPAVRTLARVRSALRRAARK